MTACHVVEIKYKISLFQMALFSGNLYIFSALLILFGTSSWTKAEDDEDGVSVETIEEETYQSPQIDKKNIKNLYFSEHFDDENSFRKKWVQSEAKKEGVDDSIAKYDGKWELQSPLRKILNNDLGLVLKTEAKHAAISALLDKPFEFKGKPLVVQYEVTLQEGQNCGGAYIKLLSQGTSTKSDLRKFYDQTPYTIMFGPDKCGNDNKLHFIFRHKNPKNGSIEEKHSKKPSQRLEDIYKDKDPHLYTLVVRPDNTFTILLDNKEVNSGSLLEDFTPPVNPPEEVDDPNDKKPADWDEREKIVDPTAKKPEDWDEDAPAQIVDPNAAKPDGWLDDEPETIPDPDAKKPSDWDEEMDGEWEAPLVDNPACGAAPGCGPWRPPTVPNPHYKGIWRAPLIANPNYKGKWTPRRIPNPDYFKDDHPYKMTPIHAIGFELWSMSPMLLFDNVIVTDDPAVAEEWARQTFALKRDKLDKDSHTLWGRLLRATNYKPGWWSLYALYCAIPITIYVGYLIKCSREDSFVDRALKYAGDNPWVYGVLIVGVFLFVGVVAYVCCGGRPDVEGDIKKTDAVLEDDPHQSEGEEDAPGGEAERGDAGEAPPAAPAPAPAATKADLEGPAPAAAEPDSTEKTPLLDTDAAGDGQRKRKPRKE